MAEKDVTTWTYWLPPGPGEEYAWIVLDSTGRFASITDWGNYAYWWSNWGNGDFRDFIRVHVCTNEHYSLGKFAQDKGRVFQPDRTRKALRELIQEAGLSKQKRAEELALINDIDDEAGLTHWHAQTTLEDVSEALVYDYSAQVYAFVQKVLPRLKALLDAERAAEPKEVV